MSIRALPAVVFDLDDTLYPEHDYVLSGFQAVSRWSAENLGIDADTAFDELAEFHRAGVRGDTFDRWLHKHGLRAETWTQQLVDVYREHKPRLACFPEVPAVLAELRKSYSIGLVSDGYLEVQRRKLEGLGLFTSFDAIVFSDELGRDAWKPSTRPFREILRRLRVDAHQAVYVADNPLKDFLGARRSGISTVWVRRPDCEYTHLEPPSKEHEADFSIDSLTALEGALAKIGIAH